MVSLGSIPGEVPHPSAATHIKWQSLVAADEAASTAARNGHASGHLCAALCSVMWTTVAHSKGFVAFAPPMNPMLVTGMFP
eukprot:295933-Amphidinium_carterae.2